MKIRLVVNGSSIAVAQMGPDFLLVEHPLTIPPGNASLVLQVDRSEPRGNVHLPDGISAAFKRVAIVPSR